MEKIKIKEFIARIKKIKHIEIIIGIIAVVLMIVIYAGVSANSKDNGASDAGKTVVYEESDDWETKLAEILANVEGVGKTEVMITYVSTTEKITANTTTTNNNTSSSTNGSTNSSTSITQSPVIVTNSGKSEPYITKEIMPEVKGVIIVAEGADNPVTKLAIMRAAQTALQINAGNIEIFAMNKK